VKLEYINSSTELTTKQLEQDIYSLVNINNFDKIILPHFFIKKANELLKDSSSSISCLIDYPLGISNTESRLLSSSSINNMCDYIDITINANFLCNRKFSLIKKEVEQHKLNFPKSIPRYILEYRHFSAEFVKKACDILQECGIEHVCLSTGYFIDSIEDYLIASHLIKKHCKKLNIILYVANMSDKKINLLNNHNFGVIRSNSIYTLEQIQRQI